MLNRTSELPLHRQISDWVKAQVLAGKLEPGARLVTEPELAQALSVSRYTLRQAFDTLVHDGFISRERGRGNFIRDPRTAPKSLAQAAPMKSAGELAQPQSVRLISVNYEARVDRLLQTLELGPNDSIVEVVRLRTGEGKPLAVERLYMPHPPSGAVTNGDLATEQNARLIELWCGFAPTHARRSLRLMQPDDEVRRLLDLDENSVVFQLERVLFHDGTVLAVRESIHPVEVSVPMEALGEAKELLPC